MPMVTSELAHFLQECASTFNPSSTISWLQTDRVQVFSSHKEAFNINCVENIMHFLKHGIFSSSKKRAKNISRKYLEFEGEEEFSFILCSFVNNILCRHNASLIFVKTKL